MILYSQRDPAYSNLKLGNTTIGKEGCVVMSLATLFQVDPLYILSLPVFNKYGECDIKRCVELLGGRLAYRGIKRPTGYCMAKTAYYKRVGVPTHFFPYDLRTNECIDPLQHPTFRAPSIYPIEEYLWIEGIKLDFTREDLEKRLSIAERALPRLKGLRLSSVARFIERVKRYLRP